MVYLYFNKKKKEFSSPVFHFFIFTDFPRFQGPVRAMYQSVEKCLRMHLRGASIYKFSAGLGLDLDRYADISGWLEPCIYVY